MKVPMICSAKLGRMAALSGSVSAALFNTTANIQRRTLTADQSGGFSTVWATVHTYPCSFAPYQIRPIERESDVRVQALSFWMFSFPTGTDITPTDRIVVGDRTFEVVGSGEGSWAVTHDLVALEIQ